MKTIEQVKEYIEKQMTVYKNKIYQLGIMNEKFSELYGRADELHMLLNWLESDDDKNI